MRFPKGKRQFPRSSSSLGIGVRQSLSSLDLRNGLVDPLRTLLLMRAKISRHRVEKYSAQLRAPRGCPLWGRQMRQVLSATPPNHCVISGQAEKISVAAKFILPGLFGLVSTLTYEEITPIKLLMEF